MTRRAEVSTARLEELIADLGDEFRALGPQDHLHIRALLAELRLRRDDEDKREASRLLPAQPAGGP